jgi:hypothetical protein
VRAEADTVLGMLSIIGCQLPPKRPLSPEETAMVRPPLEATLYKYAGNVDPAVSLTLALVAIAGLRWMEWKTAQPADPGTGFAADKPAAEA